MNCSSLVSPCVTKMKVLAVLLCALVAVQARSSGVANESRALAEFGENPWLLHLRLVTSSGTLNSCSGSLITNSWALTTATCVNPATFVWVRYGTINTVHPTLVTEGGSSVFRVHPGFDGVNNDVGLVSLNRVIPSTEYIYPIALGSDVPSSARFCGFGGEDVPGEILNCFEVTLTEEDGVYIATSDEGTATKFDLGAPLVSNGEQSLILEGVSENNAGVYRPVSAYVEWIESQIS